MMKGKFLNPLLFEIFIVRHVHQINTPFFINMIVYYYNGRILSLGGLLYFSSIKIQLSHSSFRLGN